MTNDNETICTRGTLFSPFILSLIYFIFSLFYLFSSLGFFSPLCELRPRLTPSLSHTAVACSLLLPHDDLLLLLHYRKYSLSFPTIFFYANNTSKNDNNNGKNDTSKNKTIIKKTNQYRSVSITQIENYINAMNKNWTISITNILPLSHRNVERTPYEPRSKFLIYQVEWCLLCNSSYFSTVAEPGFQTWVFRLDKKKVNSKKIVNSSVAVKISFIL